MSDQTPNSSDGLNGSEPSMEDILASIRKIISDDAPVAMESPEDVPAVDLVETSASHDLDGLMQGIHLDDNDLTSDAVLDSAEAKTEMFATEGESVDLNIDDVLAGLDSDILAEEGMNAPPIEAVQPDADDALSAILDDFDDVPEALEVESLTPPADPIDPESSIFDADDDIFSLLGDDLSELESDPLLSELDTDPVDMGDDMAETAIETLAVDDDFEMDALLEDILLEPVDVEAEAQLETNAIVEDIQFDVEDITQAVQDETSLMAELSDEEAPEADISAFAIAAAGASAAGLSAAAISKVDLSEAEELSDLEMVKSLMADLADDPGELEAEDDLETFLAIPEVEPELETEIEAQEAVAVEESIYPALTKPEPILPYEMDAEFEAESEDDILGDILDMTLEDELQSHPDDLDIADMQANELTSLEDVLDAQQDNIAENALPIDEADIELPSLSDIAAAAEADALAVETIQASHAIAATAGLAAAVGGAALGATALTDDVSETEAAQIDELVQAFETTETAETHIEPTLEPISNQETSMPVKAVQTDAILDDVTEAATAGAFAELNQVVEDKATFNERGPRIGDLVQDALRPMLKEWLDANLKGIVERAVTKEVKRISSGK